MSNMTIFEKDRSGEAPRRACSVRDNFEDMLTFSLELHAALVQRQSLIINRNMS